MKATEFCYWMQGFFELSATKTLNEDQVESLRKHLDMVFIHDIDPSYPQKQQGALDLAHSGPNHLFPTSNDPNKPKPRC
jgi:hypothetical protein